MYEGFTEENAEKVKKAHDMFAALWPTERIGDDYTALMWFCEHYLADEETRRQMTAEPINEQYFKFFGGNNYERLKKYLYIKFDLALDDPVDAAPETSFEYSGTEMKIPELNEWNEYMVFNNPNRYLWEKTDEMLDFIDIKPGERIADLGCGGGAFTYQFSKRVGKKGKVYATEINQDAMKYLDLLRLSYNIQNISTLVTKMNDCKLRENSVDKVFMCSMYHAVYITDIEFVKDQFIASIKKGLRPGGELIVVDNDMTKPGTPPYYGPGIMPELMIAQLKYYGFRLKRMAKLIPQRFVLVFELAEEEGGA